MKKNRLFSFQLFAFVILTISCSNNYSAVTTTKSTEVVLVDKTTGHSTVNK